MPKTKVLVTVKTYPALSTKYSELVCTAGVKEDGSWVRIYPIPFRMLDQESRYKKYQWIELDLVKNTSDSRPESYKPVNYNQIKILNEIGTEKGLWTTRRNIILKKVYTNLNILIKEAKNRSIRTSLAVFKPKKILDFTYKRTDSEWDKKKLEHLKYKSNQLHLFDAPNKYFDPVKKLPYKFSYKFIDDENRQATLMIEDWEICQLYWKCLKNKKGNEQKALEDVRQKYFEDHAKTKDLYLFLGTTMVNHYRAPNPFIIIGTFYPKKVDQPGLF